MQQIANVMKYIVKEYHVAFLIVNLAMRIDDDATAYSDGSYQIASREVNTVDSLRPAIGKSWLDVPCTRLMIHKTNSGERRQIIVVKSTYLATQKHCQVDINEKGIVTA